MERYTVKLNEIGQSCVLINGDWIPFDDSSAKLVRVTSEPNTINMEEEIEVVNTCDCQEAANKGINQICFLCLSNRTVARIIPKKAEESEDASIRAMFNLFGGAWHHCSMDEEDAIIKAVKEKFEIKRKGMSRIKYRPLKDTTECPHCGSNFGYYSRSYVSGWVQDIRTLSDHQPYNFHMYDHINHSRESKWLYCVDCHEKFARNIQK